MKVWIFLAILLLSAIPSVFASPITPPLIPFLTIPVNDLQRISNFTYAGNTVRIGYAPGAINVWNQGHGLILVRISNCLFWYRTGTEQALLFPQELLLSGSFTPTRESILYLYLIPSGVAYAGC